MWGIVLSCFAAVEDYSGAIAIRFFLGVFEAAVTPGFALFTSQWYTKKEQGLRTGIWFSFNGFAQVRPSVRPHTQHRPPYPHPIFPFLLASPSLPTIPCSHPHTHPPRSSAVSSPTASPSPPATTGP